MIRLKLDKVNYHDLQARETTCNSTVTDYAEQMKLGVSFPPIVVFHDGSYYFLADGFHRFFAAEKNGQEDIEVEVRKGTKADALWFACGSNKVHGLRRTNADKRKAVKLALENKPESSDRAIAEHVGVSDVFVASVRKENRQVQTPCTCKETLQLSDDVLRKPTGAEIRTSKPLHRNDATPKARFPVPQPRIGQDGKRYPVPPPKPANNGDVLRDKIGRVVPEKVRPLWYRSLKISEYLQAISHLRVQLKAAEEKRDLMFADIRVQGVIIDLDNAYRHLKTVLPYAVCTACQGAFTESCNLCKGRGFISEYKWKTAVPQQMKDLVAKDLD